MAINDGHAKKFCLACHNSREGDMKKVKGDDIYLCLVCGYHWKKNSFQAEQQLQPIMCPTWGKYRYKNCKAYIGDGKCGSAGSCIHKQQAAR